jgi:hypothetical protein
VVPNFDVLQGRVVVYKEASHFTGCFLVAITDAAIWKGNKYLLHVFIYTFHIFIVK